VILSGLLPPHYLSPDPIQDLNSYLAEYLKDDLSIPDISALGVDTIESITWLIPYSKGRKECDYQQIIAFSKFITKLVIVFQ
jgi:hypothetical protein